MMQASAAKSGSQPWTHLLVKFVGIQAHIEDQHTDAISPTKGADPCSAAR